MNELVQFVEQETGRDFLEPPQIATRSIREFEADLDGQFGNQADFLGQDVRRFQALGLTDLGVADAVDAFTAWASSSEGIQGYYDSDARLLVMPDQTDDESSFQSVMVHELTHALDAQHANLRTETLRASLAASEGNFEPNIALSSLLEGRANWVQTQWILVQNLEFPFPENPPEVPPALLVELSIPYAVGEEYVRALGGANLTWDELTQPPRTTEQIFFPLGAGAADEPLDVPYPLPDGAFLGEFVFGVADMYLWLLGDTFEPDEAAIDQAYEAIEGWAGGSATMWGTAEETCIRFTVAVDSRPDRDELQTAAERWAADNDDRSVG